MTKEKKSTSKKTSKAKTVKVNEDQFDLIIDFGPAHKAQDEQEKQIAKEIAYREFEEMVVMPVEEDEAPVIKTPWYKRLGNTIKKWFNR